MMVGVLSLVECQVSAKTFHIDGDAFSAAFHAPSCETQYVLILPRGSSPDSVL